MPLPESDASHSISLFVPGSQLSPPFGDSRLMDDTQPIGHSVTQIYHNEPFSLTKIFSERWGEVLNIESPDPNHYFLEKPDGRHTEYFFENGICSKVIIDNFFTTFTFERSK